MTIKTFEVNPLGVNCYVVSDDTKEAVIIDCGCFYREEWEEIHRYIKTEELKAVHLLFTHLHFDHIMGIPAACATLGLPPEANKGDINIYNKVEDQLLQFLGSKVGHIEMPPIGRELHDGDIISFGQHKLTIIQTPGHSIGSICYYCPEEKAIFTGDTLFRMSIGRTDLQGGNIQDMMQSLEKLSALPPETIAYPGHGPKTNIADEIKYNPYMKA